MSTIHELHPHTKFVQERDAWERDLERSRQPKNDESAQVQPTASTDANAESWAEWVDALIDKKIKDAVEEMGGAVSELLNEAHVNLKRALDQRDRAIEQLSVQTEIALDNNAERQIAEARQMQLNFENKLVALQLKFDESLNEVSTNLKRALDHAIGQLNQRFEVEIGLGKKLARAEREISAARVNMNML
jgi:hypothetical protein